MVWVFLVKLIVLQRRKGLCVHCNWVYLMEFLSCYFCLLNHEASGNRGCLEVEKGKVLFS